MKAPSRSVQKAVVAAVCLIGTLWAVACGALYHVMRQPPERFARVMSRIPGPVAFVVLPFETLWLHARTGNLEVGERAPDFTLARLDTSEPTQLSSFAAQGRPVVLVFGSYT